jgi:hypothetical protein
MFAHFNELRYTSQQLLFWRHSTVLGKEVHSFNVPEK